jgi:hypothetical protein
MTRTLKLERLDGTPADPPSFKTTVLVLIPGIRSRSRPAGRFKSSAFATSTRTRCRCWSLRTGLKTV